MNIIFLDIDGVLVIRSPDGLSLSRYSNQTPHPKCIDNLNTLIRETDAKIVISSSWRIAYSLFFIRKWANHFGIPDVIIGATDTGRDARGNQIIRWCRTFANKDIDKVVVIDDDYDAFEGHNFPYIHTEFNTGLTTELMTTAIGLFDEDQDVSFRVNELDEGKYYSYDKR